MLRRLRTTVLLCAAAVAASVPALAQPRAERLWSIGAGPERVTVRDISRAGFPIETSPVGLDVDAWSIAGRHERRSAERSHTFAVGLSRSTSLASVSPLVRVRHPEDTLDRVEGRYEYRRAFWRDRFARGLDLEAGVLGLAAWQALEQHRPPATRLTVRDREGGGGGLLGLRLRRWSRVRLETSMTVGLLIGSSGEDATSPDPLRSSRPGGGWLLDSRTGGSLRIGERYWLSAHYVTTGQVRVASHRAQSDRRGRLELAVTHVR
jgi:hypothetical protein